MLARSIQAPDEQGVVWKQGKWFGMWKRRYFVLKDEILYNFEADKKSNPIKQARDSFNLADWRFEIHQDKKSKTRPHMFRMFNDASKVFYFLAADSEKEMMTWLNKGMQVHCNAKFKECIPKVIKCQALMRRVKPRQEYNKLKHCATKIQTLYRAQQERANFLHLRAQLVKIQAVARRWFAKRDYKAIVRRKRIVTELMQTEQVYVENMLCLIEVFLNPLLESSRSATPLLPNHEVLQIFGNIVQLHHINAELLKTIEKRAAKWNRNTIIGDVFSELIMDKILTIYTTFVLQYGEAMECIDRAKKRSPQFRDWLEHTYDTPRVKQLDLPSFLIQPVQRLPRYELLLKDIIRHTEKTHPDYSHLTASLQRVTKVTSLINERKGDKENVAQIISLQKKLVGPLVDKIEWDSRYKLLREGEGTCTADPKTCYLFLLNEFILLASKEKGASYELRGIVPLADASVSVDFDNESIFMKLGSSEHVSITVPKTCKAWAADVKRMVEYLRSKTGAQGLSFSTGSLMMAPRKHKLTKLISVGAGIGGALGHSR